MRVLIVGGTGNLGSQLISAVIAHGHQPYIFLRSKSKLESKLSSELFQHVQSSHTIIEGDAQDPAQIQEALENHDIRYIINVAGTRDPKGIDHTIHKIVDAIVKAATALKIKEGCAPLRVWLIGGLGSVRYPGTPHDQKLEDYMPSALTAHHRATVEVLKQVSKNDVRWTLLCVAMMYDREKGAQVKMLEQPTGNRLKIGAEEPPEWRDSIVRWIPFVGLYLNFWVVVLGQYWTWLEDVADFLAAQIDNAGEDEHVGTSLAMKDMGRA